MIFVTIDNQEDDNLKKLCHEVFGEENYVATIVWQKKVSPANDAQWFSSDHDYVLVYARSKEIWRPEGLDRTESQSAYYKNPDNDSRGPWNSATYTCNKTRTERPNLFYPIRNPKTGEDIWPKETAVWKYARDVAEKHAKENCLYWGVDGTAKFPRMKLFLNEMGKVVPRSMWAYSDVGHTQEGTTELSGLFDDDVFDSPKPSRLVRRMIEVCGSKEALVLDFFAGSGTTAHAVLAQNRQDGGNRKFILVQLPEPTGREDYPTIADITKERVRRVIKKIGQEQPQQLSLINPVVGARRAVPLRDDVNRRDGANSNAMPSPSAPPPEMPHSLGIPSPDLGFRVFKLAESNFKTWEAEAPKDSKELANQLELHIDHIRDGRTTDDLLYEILIKSGFPLTTPVEKLSIPAPAAAKGKKAAPAKFVYSVAGGALLICLERELTLELIRTMAEQKPERVVCLDAGFTGNDQLKANAVQIFKTKGVTSFKTV